MSNPATERHRALNNWLSKPASDDLDRLMATGRYRSIRDLLESLLRRAAARVQ